MGRRTGDHEEPGLGRAALDLRRHDRPQALLAGLGNHARLEEPGPIGGHHLGRLEYATWISAPGGIRALDQDLLTGFDLSRRTTADGGLEGALDAAEHRCHERQREQALLAIAAVARISAMPQPMFTLSLPRRRPDDAEARR